jgi:FkbM family methyltransferase
MDLRLPKDDRHFQYYLKTVGPEYQKQHRDYSLSFVKEHDIAVDVGAHVGTWAIDLEKVFNKVICFEPIEEHRDCLMENIQHPDKVIVIGTALGDHEEDVVFLDYDTPDNSGTASIRTEGKYRCKMRTFDSYNIKKINYLKVDIEGYELNFLRGAKETIMRTKPVINIEIKPSVDAHLVMSYLSDELGMTFQGRTIKDYVYMYT